MTRPPGEEARRVAHELTGEILGLVPGYCCDDEEPDDVHSVTCDRLTAALQPYLEALEVAREAFGAIEYGIPWGGSDAPENIAVNALTRIAALVGQPGRTE